MDTEAYEQGLASLWSDIREENSFPAVRPLLAHYTSIHTLECILQHGELWFSNPLYMNDHEELRFGLHEGARAFRLSDELDEACGDARRANILQDAFEQIFNEFDLMHAFDTYILCFSRHEKQQTDGLLSMWRGYGGNGNGAALVIDTNQIEPKDDSPFIFTAVEYLTRDERLAWIKSKILELAALIKRHQPDDDKLLWAANAFFERNLIFALCTKHQGFEEEREWRVIYQAKKDVNRVATGMLNYSISKRGIEPRLRFKLQAHPTLANDLSLEKLVNQIILGPSLSGLLARKSVERMLEQHGQGALIERVIASTTPFRHQA